tara:strand:+ start:59 stop:1681 length:1623 start_codon:yes stop_codon:yes gene_type:complete
MVLDTALDLGGGMFDALNSLRKSIEAAGDKLQKASLALGKDFSQVNAEITPAMEGLRGSLDQRVGAAIAGLQAGLQGNSAGVAKLINQQQLTGTASAQTATVMAKLSQSLNANNDDINNLSDRIIETGKLYTVSTDKLVAAVDALSDTFPTQQLAGMGIQVTEAMASLTAQMPAMAGQVTSVMKKILDPSLKTEANLARLGIAGVRERLTAAKTASEAERILVGAIRTAGQNITSFVDKDLFLSVGIATNVFGETTASLAAMNEQLGKRTKNEAERPDFGDTIEAIRASILVPLQKVLRDEFYPAIKRVSSVLGGIGERFSVALSKWIAKLDLSDTGINNFTDSLVNGAIGLVQIFATITNHLIDFNNVAIPAMKSAWNSITELGEKMGGLSKIFNSVMHAQLMASNPAAYLTTRGGAALLGAANTPGTTPADPDAVFEKIDPTALIGNLKGLLSTSQDSNTHLATIATATSEINNKTLDPLGTSEFLTSSSSQLSRNMQAIMGITPDDAMEETNAILIGILGAFDRDPSRAVNSIVTNN